MQQKLSLYRRQYETLDYLRTYFRKHKRPPTTEEFVIALGCHKTTVFVYLMQLELGGYITKERGKLETLQITPAGWVYVYEPKPRPTGYHRKPRVAEWKPQGGSLDQRIERIVDRAKANGTYMLGQAIDSRPAA